MKKCEQCGKDSAELPVESYEIVLKPKEEGDVVLLALLWEGKLCDLCYAKARCATFTRGVAAK